MISFKTIFIGYTAFLFRSSNSEQDTNLTDYHYSWPSNKIYVAYVVYLAFLFRPSIYWKTLEKISVSKLYYIENKGCYVKHDLIYRRHSMLI